MSDIYLTKTRKTTNRMERCNRTHRVNRTKYDYRKEITTRDKIIEQLENELEDIRFRLQIAEVCLEVADETEKKLNERITILAIKGMQLD